MRAKIFATLIGAFLLSVPSATQSADKSNIDCLTLGMYHEARAESTEGIKAVGYVILNRTKSRGFPSTACKVLYQKNQFSGIKNTRITDQKTFKKVYKLAETVYADPQSDNTAGATYFHELNARPKWSKKFKFTVQIDNHKFYKT